MINKKLSTSINQVMEKGDIINENWKFPKEI